MKKVIVMKRMACGIWRQASMPRVIDPGLAPAVWIDFVWVAQAMSIRTAGAKMMPNAMAA